MATSQLTDEHFGVFLIAWVWVYLVPAVCFYVNDARHEVKKLLLYFRELPSLWRSIIAWWFAADGRQVWSNARIALEREEKAFEKQIREEAHQAAVKRGVPTVHGLGSASSDLQRIVNQLRVKTPKSEAYRSAASDVKATSARRPLPHKDAMLGLHLLQRSMLLLARYAMLGWIRRTFMYDPWAILGVEKLASAKEVERAFRAKITALSAVTGRRDFAGLEEAKDLLMIAAANVTEGAAYTLPSSVNNMYVASFVMLAALSLPIIWLAGGASSLSLVVPVVYSVSHVALLIHLFCVQLQFPVWTVVIGWCIFHFGVLVPVLVTRNNASRLLHPLALWSVWLPPGFIQPNWLAQESSGAAGATAKDGTAGVAEDAKALLATVKKAASASAANRKGKKA